MSVYGVVVLRFESVMLLSVRYLYAPRRGRARLGRIRIRTMVQCNRLRVCTLPLPLGCIGSRSGAKSTANRGQPATPLGHNCDRLLFPLYICDKFLRLGVAEGQTGPPLALRPSWPHLPRWKYTKRHRGAALLAIRADAVLRPHLFSSLSSSR